MMSQKTYLKSGYLVVGNVTQRGCATYRQENRTGTRVGDGLEEDWQAHKSCASVEEQKKVSAYRSIFSSKIAALGTYISGFGYLVQKERGQELEDTLRGIEAAVAQYNSEARYTRLGATFAIFETQATDEKVARALYGKVVGVLTEANKAIQAGDVKGLREALDNLKGTESMLPEETGQKLSRVIKMAREAAKRAVKAIKEGVTEMGTAAVVKQVMAEVDVSGVRAGMIEMEREITSEIAGASYVPECDVRQVEIDIAAEIEMPIEEKRKAAALKAAATRKANGLKASA